MKQTDQSLVWRANMPAHWVYILLQYQCGVVIVCWRCVVTAQYIPVPVLLTLILSWFLFLYHRLLLVVSCYGHTGITLKSWHCKGQRSWALWLDDFPLTFPRAQKSSSENCTFQSIEESHNQTNHPPAYVMFKNTFSISFFQSFESSWSELWTQSVHVLFFW